MKHRNAFFIIVFTLALLIVILGKKIILTPVYLFWENKNCATYSAKNTYINMQSMNIWFTVLMGGIMGYLGFRLAKKNKKNVFFWTAVCLFLNFIGYLVLLYSLRRDSKK